MSRNRTVVAVIDDNLRILGAMGRLLSAYGYDTELYVSAQEFLDAVLTTEAACLVVDLHLRDRSGIDFARQLRHTGVALPVVFMAASDDELIKKQAAETGCIAILRKPFPPHALLNALVNLSYFGNVKKDLILKRA